MKIKKLMKFTKYIFATVSFLAAAIPVYDYWDTTLTEYFGQDTNDLVIVNAKLEPSRGFFEPLMPDLNEAVSLHLKIRNLSNKEYLLTSADIEVFGTDKATLETYGSGSLHHHLGSDPAKGEIIKFMPGEEKIIVLSQGITLKGITSFFKSEKFRNALFSKIEDDYFLHDLRLVEELNSEFSKEFGNGAGIRISLNEKYKIRVKEHRLKFANGSDLFEHDGKFQHDLFMAAVRKVQDTPSLKMASW